jgi:hypothetical protein
VFQLASTNLTSNAVVGLQTRTTIEDTP